MLDINTLRALTSGKRSVREPAGQKPVEPSEVRRMYAFANTVDPRLIELLKLVERVRIDRLRQGLFFTGQSG